MSESITITIPDPLLSRLTRLAQAAHRPVEDVVLTTLSESIPAPPQGLPQEIKEELTALELLSDEELQEVARSSKDPADLPPEPYSPGDETDRLALRKAYALVLLKWRGHTLDELQGLAG